MKIYINHGKAGEPMRPILAREIPAHMIRQDGGKTTIIREDGKRFSVSKLGMASPRRGVRAYSYYVIESEGMRTETVLTLRVASQIVREAKA